MVNLPGIRNGITVAVGADIDDLDCGNTRGFMSPEVLQGKAAGALIGESYDIGQRRSRAIGGLQELKFLQGQRIEFGAELVKGQVGVGSAACPGNLELVGSCVLLTGAHPWTRRKLTLGSPRGFSTRQ